MVRIRRCQRGDKAPILALRRRVFGDLDPVRLREKTWEWQFRRNPAGRAWCALAEDQGRIVGHHAVIPTRFSVHGKERRFGLSCDTMTHPDYRRKGLFKTVGLEAYRWMESELGVSTVWGFPNDASLTGFTRYLGWRVLTVFPLRVVPLRPLAMVWAHLRKKPAVPLRRPPAGRTGAGGRDNVPDLPGGGVEPVSHFGGEFDSLWLRHQALAPVIQVRDAAYLNWRYREVPEFGYRTFAVRIDGTLSGYLVLRMMSLMGHFFGLVVDLFPFPLKDRATTRRLLRFARDHCRAQGAEFMTCLISGAHGPGSLGIGMRTIPSRLNPRPWHFGARYAPGEEGVLGRAVNWHMTYGDTDIV